MSRLIEFENRGKKLHFPKLISNGSNHVAILEPQNPYFDVSEMRSGLCKGLMKAFISENRKLKNTEFYSKSVNTLFSVPEKKTKDVYDDNANSMEYKVCCMLEPCL